MDSKSIPKSIQIERIMTQSQIFIDGDKVVCPKCGNDKIAIKKLTYLGRESVIEGYCLKGEHLVFYNIEESRVSRS